MIQQSTKAAVVVFHSTRKQELAKKLARLWTKWLQLRLHSNVVSLLLNIKSLRENTEHSHGLQQLYYTLRNKCYWSGLYLLHALTMARGARGSSSCLLDAYVCFDSRLRDINFWIYVNNYIFIIVGNSPRNCIWCVLRLALGIGAWRPPGPLGCSQPAVQFGLWELWISEIKKSNFCVK